MVNWIIMIALAAATAVGLLLWLRRNNPTQKTQKKSPRTYSKYRSVRVHYEQAACYAVKKLKDEPFLSQNAPMLPLAGCTAKQCLCKYVHLEDRREEDRRTPLVRFFVDSGGANRRTSADRRTAKRS